MNNFGVLLLKEERALFSSPIAYVVMTVFLLIMGYSFTLTLFLSHQPSLVHVFFQIFVLFMLTVPLITMRLLAEERKLRTLEVLLTAPVSEIEIVLAKFVASMSLIALMLLLSGAYAAVLVLFGDPDLGPIYSGYLGLILFGSALVGVGLLASALTANQIIAAIVSLSAFLAPLDHRQFRLAAAEPVRHAGGQSVAFGPFPAVRHRLGVPVRCRLLSQRRAADAVAERARARTALRVARMLRAGRSNIVVATLVGGAIACGALGFAGLSEEVANSLLFAAWALTLLALFMLALRLPLRGRGSRLSAWISTALVTGAAIAITIGANIALYRHDVHFDVSREGRNTPPAQFAAVIDHLQPSAVAHLFLQQRRRQCADRQRPDGHCRTRSSVVRLPRHRSRQGAGPCARRRRARLQHRRIPGRRPQGDGREQHRRHAPRLCGAARAQGAGGNRVLHHRPRRDVSSDAAAFSLQPRRNIGGSRRAGRRRRAGR